MPRPQRVVILSDIHYASAAEQAREGYEQRVIRHRVVRSLAWAYRHYIWLRDPLKHSHLLDRFLAAAGEADAVVGVGDYSCDSAFVGVSDDAAFQSVAECLGKLRGAYGDRFEATLGDHEIGKGTLFGGAGGLRLASYHRATGELGIRPCWCREVGNHVLLGVFSSLLALPVFEPETLPEELPQWRELRRAHLADIDRALASLDPRQKLILFCHDPTALPYLWDETALPRHAPQLERTVLGHLHTNLVFWQSRVMAGMPEIGFLGQSVRRMSRALRQARVWRHFRPKLCPALAGIELLKDGGFLSLDLSGDGQSPSQWQFHPIPR
jgi:hypothetical protein